jgi:hypothetical protein
MQVRRLSFLILIAGAALVGTAVWLWTAQEAIAQCGSQASSCKNCHEVQAQKPVNADGTGWHQGHAFGDFCANCHAGNVQATDKVAAHTGIVAPLSDVQANCAGCHPSDVTDRAKKYAGVLGVTIGTGGGNAPTNGGGSAPTPNPAPTQPVASTSIVVSEPGVIDYAQRYDQTVSGTTPINWGNMIVGALIIVAGAGGGSCVYWNERRLRGKARRPTTDDGQHVAATKAVALEDYPTGVLALLPRLACLNPVGLHALKQLLAEPDQASELLYALARLDPELVRRIRALDRETKTMLLAMAGD